MNDNVVNIDAIRRDAQRAAAANEAPVQACKHPFGSPAARLWMVEYIKHVNHLTAQLRARQGADHIDTGPEAA